LWVALGLAAGLFGCYDPEPPPKNFEEKRMEIPLSESYDVTYRFLDRGRLEAIMTAPYIREMPQKAPNKTITYADSGLRIRFFDERERQKSFLRANWAVLRDYEGTAEARGNVVLINEGGDTLRTEKLFWNRPKKRITTPAFVTITTPEEIVMGDSLVSNTDFTEYTIYKIRGTIQVNEEGE
jgi:LPS export ABC transporter protein LptC